MPSVSEESPRNGQRFVYASRRFKHLLTCFQRGQPEGTAPTPAAENPRPHPENRQNLTVNLTVTINVFPVAGELRQENAPNTTIPQAVNLDQILQDVISRSGILETALRLMADSTVTVNTPASSNHAPQAERPRADRATHHTAASEGQQTASTTLPPTLNPEQFGFVRVDTEANDDDENTLYWRNQHHSHSGSAAQGSFSGPYTQEEMLQIVREETS